jgi:DhnA family fructose-bisphosphate aldolase class Ia
MDYEKAYKTATENIAKLSKRLAEEMGVSQCKCACSGTNCYFHLKLCTCSTPGCKA